MLHPRDARKPDTTCTMPMRSGHDSVSTNGPVMPNPGSAEGRVHRLGGNVPAAPLATDHPALLFGEPTPDAGVLIRVERVLEALGSPGAFSADLARLVDLNE